MRPNKLWNYAQVARLWGRSLVIVAVMVLIVAASIEATRSDGLAGGWVVATAAALVSSLVIFFFLLRMWMRATALFSARLPSAKRVANKPVLHEADGRDWRRWAIYMVGLLFVASAFMMLFLVGLLGTGGTAEGVVVGCIAAWGLVTLEDVRRITAREHEEGRRYFAACPRPLGVADHLVWRPANPGRL